MREGKRAKKKSDYLHLLAKFALLREREAIGELTSDGSCGTRMKDGVLDLTAILCVLRSYDVS